MKASVKRMSRPSRQFTIAVGEALFSTFWGQRLAILNGKFPNHSLSGVIDD